MNPLSQSSNYYLPAFFFMYIDTSEDLSLLENISYESKKTLYHEYTHFLQDITSVFGLARISQTVRQVSLMTNNIINSGSKSFAIPVSISNSATLSNNFLLFNLYDGDFEIPKDLERILSYRKEENGKIFGFEKEPIVIVSYIDEFDIDRSFNMGSICLLESMAYSIEKYLFDDTTLANFPYRTVEMFLDTIYPVLSTDLRYIIALCDISLGSFNPAKTFVEVVEKMKDENFIPNNVEEIYSYLSTCEVIYKNKKIDYYDLYYELYDETKSDLSGYFTTTEVAVLRDWTIDLLKSGFNLKKEHWVKKVLSLTKPEAIGYYKYLMSKTGLPLFSNNKDYTYCSNNSDEFFKKASLLRAIIEVHQLLNGYHKNCNMKTLCKQYPGGDITDKNCDRPWLRSNYLELCPFAQLWKMWGLQNFQPK